MPGSISYTATPAAVSSGLARLSALLTALGTEHQVGRVATGEVFMTKGSRADWVAETFSPGKEETRRNPDGFQEFLTQPDEKFSVKMRAGAYWYSF